MAVLPEVEGGRATSESNDDLPFMMSLTDELGTSEVDELKLLKLAPSNMKPVGMSNFRQPFQRKASAVKVAKTPKDRWKEAAHKIKLIKDPWAKFEIDKYPVEHVVRHRYNPVTKSWKKDNCVVKVESKQFANGAMRSCFRLKKLSNFSHDTCWKTASNYVAKCYIDDQIPKSNYFDDVKVQMDAKLWAEIYNRFNPPKKIDMFQMCIIEFKDRPNSPLFHLEHYIQGNYVKYNSNSGYVDVDSHLRNTPHAFSHFTFECSNHEQIVVDIQGVGDLYTDPQIHTASGTEYGDGNLGVKGFALFFHSHICNEICASLGLSQFDLSANEIKANQAHLNVDFQKSNMVTKTKDDVEPLFFTGNVARKYHHSECESLLDASDADNREHSPTSAENLRLSSSSDLNVNVFNFHHSDSTSYVSNSPCMSANTSVVDSPFFSDEAFKYVNSRRFNKPRPSAVTVELGQECMNRLHDFQVFESILGKVHLELCKYHEIGRFLLDEGEEPDHGSAFFHMQQAAKLGELDSLYNLAKIYMGMPRDLLPEYEVEKTDGNYGIGFDYMVEAAEKGELAAMHFVAKVFDSGFGLSVQKAIDWRRAVDFYRKILSEKKHDKYEDEEKTYCEASNDFDSDYVIISRLGEMYLEGAHGLEKDPQEASDLFLEAADKAVHYGKGRLANKYYTLADKAMALID